MIRKLFFLIFIVTSSTLNAQNKSFSFKYLNVSDGLSNNSVNTISQDKFGQMWFGTKNGLNKYDGNNFTTYKNIPKELSSLSNSNIRHILQEKSGLIWIGTDNGLNKYNPKKNRFRRYYSYSNKKNTLSSNLVLSSLEVSKEKIWFGTEKGVSIYNKKEDTFTRILYNKNNRILVNDIILSSKNKVWLATSIGLIRVTKNKKGNYIFKTYNLRNNKNNFVINTIFESELGILSVGTKNNGYLIFDIKKEEFKETVSVKIPNNIDVRDFEKDNDGNLWIATKNGVFIYTKKKKTIVLQEDKDFNSGINQNFIKTIFKDKNGSIWLGTQTGGINFWDKLNENFKHLKNPEISNNVANSISIDKDANVYFGTQSGVINKIDKQGNIFKLFEVKDNLKTIDYPVQSLLVTKNNFLWVGTLNKGIYVYDLKSKKITNNIISNQLKNHLENTSVLDIKQDNLGNIWLGTFGKGAFKYNIKTKEITILAKPLLTTNIIKSLHIVNEKNILLAGSGGVTIVNVNSNNSFTSKSFLDDNKFLRFNINRIHKDLNGNIWVGTATKGLYKFNGKSFNKVFINTENQISTVYTILEGDKDILWLSTDKGIIKYNVKSRESTIHKQNNNITNSEFIPNSGVKLEDQFYFGNLKGITTFNSKKIKKISYVPKVLLSDFKIKNQSVVVGDKQSVLSKSIGYTNQIELGHTNSNFSITYALPTYVNSEGNKYAYRLKGLDDSWTYTKQTEAFFTLQTPGSYTFQVKASNYNNVWNKKTTSLNIVIKPAPWQTWWAYTFYFIAVFGLFYGVSWMLQSKARLRNKLELEYLENQRIEELNKSKLQFFTNISHEFRTPLTLILGPLQNILHDYTGSNAIYKKLKIIDSSANHLLRLINRLMDFRKLESNQLVLKAAEGNIVKFLKEIYLSFSEHAKMGKYEYDFKSSDDEILVYFDRYKLERVFFNLISNAFRYTPEKGKISVIIEKGNENVILKVKDSGVGVSEEYLDKIFDRFFEIPIHNKYDKQYNRGTGIGLSIAKNIVKLHRGSIAVKNQKPNGAIFTVKLKLGNQHLLESEIQENFKKSDDVSQYAVQMDTPKILENTEIEDSLLEDKEYTILIVEDNIVLRSFIKEILKPNYNVLQAENGKIALEKAIKHLPDLIISDVIMPEMVGTELCSKIKTTLATSHIPVILLTSRTSLIYKFEGLESGADDYISKPFDLKEFNLKIHNLLSAKQRIKDKFSSKENLTAIDISLTSIDEQMLKKALKIVKENIANPDFNIEEFTESLGVSRSMLYAKIKAWTNATPKDFIKEIRLKHAAQLIELNKLNVSEIAYEVGFKRPKYFSQCFQKKYGLTPSEFSKKFNSSS